jgi:metallo-beta-lactamase family protein
LKLTVWGAARTVTGTMILVEANGARVLLDCGLFQGRRSLSYERNLRFPFEPASLHAVILSHAHIDHSGNLPNLVKQGYQGLIWSTSATRDLCASMLLDSGHIQEADVKYLNKKLVRKGEPPVEPLYTRADATRSMTQFVSLGYDRSFPVAPGITAHFLDAGHILGSAMVVLEVEEEGRTRRLVFSGDVGRPDMAILRDPSTISEADFLIMESTYGSRRHQARDDARATLRKVILDAYHRRGKVLIPAFAVGRTQELVYDLHQLADAQKIPPIKIFVDSPLAVDVTQTFRLHPECYDQETHEFMLSDHHHRDVFGFHKLTYVRDVEASKALNYLQEPAVIISASGMCEAGRILHHLKHNIEDRDNTILFVGFQAEHTLGRRILDGEPRVRIFGEEYDVRARVESIDGYSAHADSAELREWAGHFDKEQLQRIFLVHGEFEAASTLADLLHQDGFHSVEVPERGQTFTL